MGQLTVGEMIANHHSTAAIWRAQAETKAFAATEIGAAFFRFERALTAAAMADCAENISDKRLRAVWDTSDKARQELLTLLKQRS